MLTLLSQSSASTHLKPKSHLFISFAISIYSATDPFMYYSIPGVLKASLNLKEVDYSNISSLSHVDSHPSSPQPQEEVETDASKVSRKSRISFECHPSELLEELMDDLDGEFDCEELDFEDILSEFRNRTSTPTTRLQ